MRSTTLILAAAGACLAGGRVAAQNSRPMAAYVQAGASSGQSETGALVGGRLARDLSRFLAVEAGVMHLDRGPGVSGFRAEASVMLGVLPSDRRVAPYLTLGGGLYRAAFDLSHARFDPRGPAGGASAQPGATPGTGLLIWVDSLLPDFYAQRLAETVTAPAPLSGTRVFTDPALSFGGGIRLHLGSRGFFRPEARALRVTHDGATQTLGLFTFELGYRF